MINMKPTGPSCSCVVRADTSSAVSRMSRIIWPDICGNTQSLRIQDSFQCSDILLSELPRNPFRQIVWLTICQIYKDRLIRNDFYAAARITYPYSSIIGNFVEASKTSRGSRKLFTVAYQIYVWHKNYLPIAWQQGTQLLSLLFGLPGLAGHFGQA